MRISVKGRYALAAVSVIAAKARDGENVTVSSISEKLGISRIYLEQVFSQLKKDGILVSEKGPKGGYRLSSPPHALTAWDVLNTLETGLSERTEETVAGSAPEIEQALNEAVYKPLGDALRACLSGVSVQRLADLAEEQRGQQAFMLNM